jgi:hypothetical protein
MRGLDNFLYSPEEILSGARRIAEAFFRYANKAEPGMPMGMTLDGGPDAYSHFDAREDGWT